MREQQRKRERERDREGGSEREREREKEQKRARDILTHFVTPTVWDTRGQGGHCCVVGHQPGLDWECWNQQQHRAIQSH